MRFGKIGSRAAQVLPIHNETNVSVQIFLRKMTIFASWGSGANIWGPEKDEKFTKPNHWDGMLEVVGVQGNNMVRFHSEDPFQCSLF